MVAEIREAAEQRKQAAEEQQQGSVGALKCLSLARRYNSASGSPDITYDYCDK